VILPAEEAHQYEAAVARAVTALTAGALVVYPTDTAYGLGCDSDNRRAIERLYQLKQRELKKPLSLICPDLSAVSEYTKVSNTAYRILKDHLPGAFTFVLPAGSKAPKTLLPRKRKAVGVRVPDHPIPLALARGLGRALVTSTTCLEGEAPLTEPWAIQAAFGHSVEFILDGGVLPSDRESTVVDLREGSPNILRQGVGELRYA